MRLNVAWHNTVALIYLVCASVYIVGSGVFLALVYEYDAVVLQLEILKGLGFVVVTSSLLWYALKRADEVRLFGETRFRTLVESLDDAVLVLRLPERVIIYANPAVERLFGYPESALLGADTRRLHTSDARFEAFQARSSAVLAEGVPYRGEFEMRTRAGDTFPSEHLVSSFSMSGGAGYAVSVIRDITERRRREDALRDSEERFRQIAENLREVFWITSPDKQVMEYVSPAFEQVWGHAPAKLYANPGLFLEAVHPEDRPAVEAALPLQAEGRYDVEYRIVRPDGEFAWIRDRAVPISDDLGRIQRIVGVADDITALKAAESRLQQSQKMEAIGNLAGGIAHDFNNLLTVILGNLESLRDGNQRLPADGEIAVEAALRAAERGADLTRQLLAFARSRPVTPRTVDVNSLIESSSTLFRRTLGQDIALEIELAEPPPHVLLDPAQLESALLNLAVNARDAMPRGGRLTIATRRACAPAPGEVGTPDSVSGDHVVIEVADTGVGMSSEVKDRVFEPFFTTKEVGKGTGLGLSMVFGFVRQAGGDIAVRSGPGEGTVVSLWFELVDTPAAVVTGGPGGEVASGDGLQGVCVLVVEDDAPVRDLVTRQLRRLGCEVLEAEDALIARQVLETRMPGIDLVVTDLMMPGGVNGLDLAREAKARWPALRILLSSGYPDRASAEDGRMPPDIGFIAKPFRARQLGDKVRAMLGRR